MDTRSMIVCIVVALLLVLLAASPVACTMHRQRLVAEAIKGGADPIAAKCAIEGSDGGGSSSICIIKAAAGR